MAKIIDQFKEKSFQASQSLGTLILRCVSGLVIGLFIAVILSEFIHRNPSEHVLSFLFIVVTVTLVFYRVTRAWKATGLLILDLIFFLILAVLRLYVELGPQL